MNNVVQNSFTRENHNYEAKIRKLFNTKDDDMKNIIRNFEP